MEAFILASSVLFFTLQELCIAQQPLRILPVKILTSGPNGTCPSESQLTNAMNEIKENFINFGLTEDNPASSCKALVSNSPSGYYWILPSTGPPAVQIYCDFNRQCGCDGPSTWTRVAFLNMTDPNQVCPSNFMTISSSSVRACGKGQASSRGCISVSYSTFGLAYSRVCGRIIAYQDASTDALAELINSNGQIDGPYLDGVSLTHGVAGSRQHIWSFVSAIGEVGSNYQSSWQCACSNSNPWPHNTSFVGNDYFCDSGNHGSSWTRSIYSSDPLWDGKGCGSSSTCCQFNNPPWFCKTLNHSTNNDLEVRICKSGDFEDTPIELLELYVQ